MSNVLDGVISNKSIPLFSNIILKRLVDSLSHNSLSGKVVGFKRLKRGRLPLPHELWQVISMDFILGLTMTIKGCQFSSSRQTF